MNDDVVPVVAAVLLVLAAGGLACLEAALSRVSRVRVEELVRDGARGAGRLQSVLSDPPRHLNLLLLLRLLAETTATVLVAFVAVDALGTGGRAAALTASLMVIVSYVLVGVAPRTIGRQQAERVGLRFAGVALVLTRLFGPLPRLLILLGNAITPGRGFREGPFASEAELRDLVELAQQGGVVERRERDMIESVFELGDTLVREVMVPRTDIVFIERSKTLRQALNLHLRSGFTRIPVVGENEDDVVGISYIKDLVRKVQDLREGERSDRVEDVMRPATFVPDSKPIDELLREMQARQIHMAVVIDEYGGTAGVVTIEDILEEIVGEIADEYDKERPPVEEVDERTTRVTARLPVQDLAEITGVDLPTDDADTVGGLLATLLGRVPIPGATVHVGGLTLTAENTGGRRNRIDTVLVSRDEEGADSRRAPQGSMNGQGESVGA